MKIIVNKEAAQKRADEIVDRVFKEAATIAKEGKTEFSIYLSNGEMNGLDEDSIVRRIFEESEKTIKFKHAFKSGDSYFHLKIVEVNE